MGHDDAERAADFALRQVFAVLDQKLLFGDENPVRFRPRWPELECRLARAARAYLLGSGTECSAQLRPTSTTR